VCVFVAAVEFVKKADRPEVGAPKVKPAAPGAVLVRAVAGSVKLSTVVPRSSFFFFFPKCTGIDSLRTGAPSRRVQVPRSLHGRGEAAHDNTEEEGAETTVGAEEEQKGGGSGGRKQQWKHRQPQEPQESDSSQVIQRDAVSLF